MLIRMSNVLNVQDDVTKARSSAVLGLSSCIVSCS